jgi:CDK inhibitor PHO81
VCILYPTAAEIISSNFELSSFGEINKYVDSILAVLFDHAREVRKISSQRMQIDSTTSRSLVFSSANPDVCTALNWKQPNYPVFFEMDGIRFGDDNFRYVSAHGFPLTQSEDRKCVSLKEAVNFASTNNLLGVICNERLLRLVPRLIESIRAVGLVLVAHGDPAQIIEGVDGVRDDHGLVFKQDIDM